VSSSVCVVMKRAIVFAEEIVEELSSRPPAEVFALKTPFDEHALLLSQLELLTRALSLSHLQIFSSTDANAPDSEGKKAQAVPGRPAVHVYHKT